jgi:hypothetical protein
LRIRRIAASERLFGGEQSIAFDELCGVDGIYQRHLQSMEKNAWPTAGLFAKKRKRVLPPIMKLLIF